MKWTTLEHAPVSLKLWPSLRQKRPFAQAIGSRLGETIIRKNYKFREPSLGRALIASARLLFAQKRDSLAWAASEVKHIRFPRVLASPEWDDSSLKTKVLRLSESSSSNLGQFMIFSPRRDKFG